MRRILALTLVAAVLLAGCTATPLQSAAGGASDESTVSVSASGSATADPDLAIVSLSAGATADSAATARGRVATGVSGVRTALADAGVPDANVTTVGFAISPVYEPVDEGHEVSGYRASHALTVETTPDRAGEVIDDAVGAGATSVDGVQFTLSDERRATLRATALDDAMSAARTDADGLAATADRTITGVRHVSTGADFGPLLSTRSAFEDGAGTTLKPGPVTVRVSVDVTYTAA